MKEHVHSLGGKANGIISRKEALEKYYKEPNICKNCKNTISVKDCQKVSEVKLKVFCSSSCSTIFNNAKRVYKKKDIKIKVNKEKLPSFNFLLGKTKEDIFINHSNWQSARTSIRKHAVHVFETSNKEKKCCKCGYDKHYEVCHIKAVSDFDKFSMLEDINNINNLMALCPNCHWEFDNIIRVGEGVISPSS